MKVFEYFLTGENYITGYAEHNSKNRPDLIGSSEPLSEMNVSTKDSYGRLYANQQIFKIENNIITVETYIDNGIVSFRNKWSQEKINHALIKGVESKNDIDYQELLIDYQNL